MARLKPSLDLPSVPFLLKLLAFLLMSPVPKSGETPRGLLVQVCADNLVDDLPDSEQNNRPIEECIQMLSGLEYNSILVRD